MKTTKLFMTFAVFIGAAAYACAESASTAAAPASSLGASNTRKPLKALVSDVKASADPKERVKRRMQLTEYTPQNAADIQELLDVAESEGKGSDLQRDVLLALKHVKDPSQAPIFIQRMKKKGDPFVRTAAINKLADMKVKDAVPDLMKLVDDFTYEKRKLTDESNVPFAAFYALGEINDERAIPTVLKKLGKMDSQDAQVIAKFGKKVAPQLLDIIRTSNDPAKAREAGNAMGLMTDKELVPEMWRVFHDEKDKAWYTAMNVLLNLADKTTSPTADEVMDNVVASAKTNPKLAGKVLDVARRRKDIPYLIRTFQDSNVPGNLRTAAINFLGEFKAQSAVPALEEALKSTDRSIQMEAAYALKRITGKDYSGEMK